MIRKLVKNRNFKLTTGKDKQSRLWRPKVASHSDRPWTPLFCNTYFYNLPSLVSKKYAYADDLALLHTSNNWNSFEGVLKPKHDHTFKILADWRLKLSHSKTVTTAFHLNNQETKRKLAVYNNNNLTYCHFAQV